jgi:hypothetical protein
MADAGRDDAGDGVGDGGLAVLVAAQAALTGGVAGVERGVEGEVRADQRHEEKPDAARDFGDDGALAGRQPVGLGDDGGCDERGRHEGDNAQDNLLDDAVGLPGEHDGGDQDAAGQGPPHR